MKKTTKVLRIGAVILICLVVAFLGLGLLRYAAQTPSRRGRTRIFEANHQAVLTACRYLITKRDSLTNEQNRSWRPQGAIFISSNSAQFSHAVPPVLQALRPCYIEITGDYVMLYVAFRPRILLFGFAEGADQHGITKLIDGLWYSDGTSETSNGANQVPEDTARKLADPQH
jgi:hypothetical protein